MGKDSPFLLLPFHVVPGPLFSRTKPRIQLAKAWEMGLFGFQPQHYTGECGRMTVVLPPACRIWHRDFQECGRNKMMWGHWAHGG